jgi:hypothetical protein
MPYWCFKEVVMEIGLRKGDVELIIEDYLNRHGFAVVDVSIRESKKNKEFIAISIVDFQLNTISETEDKHGIS